MNSGPRTNPCGISYRVLCNFNSWICLFSKNNLKHWFFQIFRYTGSIFKRAYERDLDKDDLYDVVSSCKSNKLGNALEEKWNEEKVKENPKSIYRILWNMFYVRYFLLGAMELTFKIVKR